MPSQCITSLSQRWISWDRNKSIEDISPLVAVTMAFGAATHLEVPKGKIYDSVYEDRGVIVL